MSKCQAVFTQKVRKHWGSLWQEVTPTSRKDIMCSLWYKLRKPIEYSLLRISHSMRTPYVVYLPTVACGRILLITSKSFLVHCYPPWHCRQSPVRLLLPSMTLPSVASSFIVTLHDTTVSRQSTEVYRIMSSDPHLQASLGMKRVSCNGLEW